MTDTYSKLMSTIVTSSVWCEPDATFRVWIALLAMKDRNGVVRASIPGLANLCGFKDQDGRPLLLVDGIALAERAIKTFLSPDPHSRTTAHEGRRIETVPGGWRVLNHEFYRDEINKEDRREKKAGYERERRTRLKSVADTAPPPPAPESNYTVAFTAFWNAYPGSNKGSKFKAQQVWTRLKLGERMNELIDDVQRREHEHGPWLKDGGQFIPHVTTYLNGRLWESPIEKRAIGNGKGVQAGNDVVAGLFGDDAGEE